MKTERLGKKIRVGLIGAGRISKKHFEVLEQFHADLELVAVCDNNQKAREMCEAIDTVATYSCLEKMLETAKLELLIICTPSGCHAEHTILAAKYGVNVVTEKPMATNLTDARAMIEECDRAGVQLFVVKQNRLNPTLKILKKAIEKGRFGNLKLAQLNVFWTRPQEYYEQGNGWRGTWEFDGGALMNQASHYVDLICWLLGPIESVQAMATTSRKIEVEDTCILNVKLRNGCLASMAVTMLTYPKNLEGSVTILGDCGTAKIGGVALNTIENWSFEKKFEHDEDIESVNYATDSVYGFGHSNYYKTIIATLKGEKNIETSGREGIKSLELIVAAYKSARDGKTVGIPLQLWD